MKHFKSKSFLSGATITAILMVGIIIFAPRNAFAYTGGLIGSISVTSDGEITAIDPLPAREGYEDRFWIVVGLTSNTTSYSGYEQYACGNHMAEYFMFDTYPDISDVFESWPYWGSLIGASNYGTPILRGGLGQGACTSAGTYYMMIYYTTSYPGPSASKYVGYYEFEFDGTNIVPPPPDDVSTRFIDFSPAYATTTATSSISLGADIFINEADYREGMFLEIDVESSQLGKAENLMQVAFPVLGFSPLPLFFDGSLGTWTFPITSSGESSFSTTTAVNYLGRFDVTYKIKYPDSILDTAFNFLSSGLGFNIFSRWIPDGKTLISKDSYFVAGEPSWIDDKYDSVIQTLASAITNSSSSLSDLETACWPIRSSETFGFAYNASSSISDCLSILLVPSGPHFRAFASSTRDNFLARAPWGYLTRFVEIASGNATTSLPSISYTFPSSLQYFGGMTIGYDVPAIISEADSLLRNELTSSDEEPKNLWEITEPYFTAIIYLLLAIRIFSRLTGIHLEDHGMFQEKSGDKNVSDESYRLKETLWKMSQRK